jgi:hypothetical protein
VFSAAPRPLRAVGVSARACKGTAVLLFIRIRARVIKVVDSACVCTQQTPDAVSAVLCCAPNKDVRDADCHQADVHRACMEGEEVHTSAMSKSSSAVHLSVHSKLKGTDDRVHYMDREDEYRTLSASSAGEDGSIEDGYESYFTLSGSSAGEETDGESHGKILPPLS